MSDSLEADILQILLEAGEEDLPTMLNTLVVQHPELQRDAFLADVEKALESLEQHSYTELNWYKNSWVRLSADERAKTLPLAQSLVWSADSNEWLWNEEELGCDYPIVRLTEQGKQFILGVLRDQLMED